MAAVLAAVLLIYLCAVPVYIAVRMRIGPDLRLGFGVSAFAPRIALRAADRPQMPARMPSFAKKIDPLDALSAMHAAISRFRFESIRLDGVLGTHDAAITALACSGTDSIVGALRATTGKNIRINLHPDFSASVLRLELVGMIRARAGHIIAAALIGAIRYATRRLKKWINTPSKAS